MTNSQKITSAACVAPLGPLSRLLATLHLAVPNHDQDGRTGSQFSQWFLSESWITAGTLPTTRLPQQRPKRYAISQRDITRLTSTVDYDGSLKNDHYGPNLQGKLASRQNQFEPSANPGEVNN